MIHTACHTVHTVIPYMYILRVRLALLGCRRRSACARAACARRRPCGGAQAFGGKAGRAVLRGWFWVHLFFPAKAECRRQPRPQWTGGLGGGRRQSVFADSGRLVTSSRGCWWGTTIFGRTEVYRSNACRSPNGTVLWPASQHPLPPNTLLCFSLHFSGFSPPPPRPRCAVQTTLIWATVCCARAVRKQAILDSLLAMAQVTTVTTLFPDTGLLRFPLSSKTQIMR